MSDEIGNEGLRGRRGERGTEGRRDGGTEGRRDGEVPKIEEKTRKYFVNTMRLRLISSLLLVAICICSCNKQQKSNEISTKNIESAEELIGLSFTTDERDSMLSGLQNVRKDYEKIRNYPVSNDIPPALLFNPLPSGYKPDLKQNKIIWDLPENVALPENRNDLAFYSIAELSVLIRQRKITSVELTQFYLDRLKKFGDTLQCVITLTEDLALQQARKADEELKKGIYRSPLHGIPYGVKDLLSLPGYPTTWGAVPYKDQVLDETATVISRLEEAGAVLVAKLTLGALAMDDVWFGGQTKNPWDLNQGSSGSSAGSASATAAGLVPFAIGTETWGSIVSPSNRCGTTGLRPTFGRVSRYGAMALAWTMDKIGPICRSADDCAFVFDVIRGRDEKDPFTIPAAFNYNPNIDLRKLKIGFVQELFNTDTLNSVNDSISLEVFRTLGAELIPVELPDSIPVSALNIILWAEASAAFDELTRSNRDTLLRLQTQNAWPNYFRMGRFIPAVEYINANRLRTLLIKEVHDLFSQFDVIICPSFEGDQLLMTNLTGHPCVVLPNGFIKGHPTSISLLGNLFDEATILAVAKSYQDATDWDEQHPHLFK
jgi:Asp-tRNA(Asn)/Glu-tRNA(Gln) amidotransferase A subunit family amidase